MKLCIGLNCNKTVFIEHNNVTLCRSQLLHDIPFIKTNLGLTFYFTFAGLPAGRTY